VAQQLGVCSTQNRRQRHHLGRTDRRILAEARPAGVSAAAWRETTRAAADSLALA